MDSAARGWHFSLLSLQSFSVTLSTPQSTKPMLPFANLEEVLSAGNSPVSRIPDITESFPGVFVAMIDGKIMQLMPRHDVSSKNTAVYEVNEVLVYQKNGKWVEYPR